MQSAQYVKDENKKEKNGRGLKQEI